MVELLDGWVVRGRGRGEGCGARGRPALSRSTTLGLAPGPATWWLMGWSRWGKRCGRSVY